MLIEYEHPLTERIRTLLRLEEVDKRFQLFLDGRAGQSHFVAMNLLFDLMEVAARADLKSDLLQELERQKQNLSGFRENPDVSTERLDATLNEIDRVLAMLGRASGKAGQHLRDSEWLMNIRGKMVMPGGACEFDVPSLKAWMLRDASLRRREIETFAEPFKPIIEAAGTVLGLLRAGAQGTKQIATNGVFQQMLGGRQYSMLRMIVDDDAKPIPEVSANKYAISIRFMTQDGFDKPRPLEGRDLAFELQYCNF